MLTVHFLASSVEMQIAQPYTADSGSDSTGTVFSEAASVLFADFGRVNEKLVPSASELSAQIFPPCCSTIVLEMAKPRPVPLRSMLPFASACSNFSNMLVSLSFGIVRP